MRRWSYLLLLLCIAPTLAPAPSHAGSEFEWRTWNAGIQEAKKSGRPVLVDVYTDWCGWCKRMDRDVYSSPAVQEYLGKQFVTIKLDAEAAEQTDYMGEKHSARSLAGRRFRVTGYPTTVFLKSSGEHLVNVPGYVPTDRFLTLLRYIGGGHFERGVPFDEFSKKDEKEAKR